MKKIFCLVMAFFVLLSLALSAQDFNPARGPLEGVWETEDEETVIFIGNLILKKNIQASFYDVVPGMVYRNGEAFGPVEPDEVQTEYDIMFDYELSENTLKMFIDGDEIFYTKSRDDILQNKGPLEGIWKGVVSDSHTPQTLIWIIAGELLIEATETDSYTEYGGGLEFVYSGLDNTLVGLGETVSCTVSGDTMIITDDAQTVVLTRER
jgi:hypothetical protein